MRNLLLLLSGLLVSSLFSGCASITRGTHEAMVIKSTPSGATVKLSSGETCVTPCVLQKKHNATFTVHVEKEGYKPVDTSVMHEAAGAGAAGMAGNVLLGGIIGGAVDAADGATQKLAPNPLDVTLEKADKASPVLQKVVQKHKASKSEHS